jgi:hypothetical protein
MAALTGYLPSLAANNVETGRTVAQSDVGTMVEVFHDSGGAITARLFNASGVLLRVVAVPGTNFNDHEPTVAMGRYGQFVVAWTDNYYGSGDLDVRAQLFNSSGYAVGGTIWVAASGHNEDQPTVGMDAYGNFAVAYTYNYDGYHDFDVYVNQYNASGGWVRSIAVATSTYGEDDPSLDMNASGQFVVAYTWFISNTSVASVYANSYNASGGSMSWHVDVGNGSVDYPSAAIDQNGNYAVAFESVNWSVPQSWVYVTRVSGVGTVLSSSQIGQTWTNVGTPSIDMSAGGQYVVSWDMEWSATDDDIYAQQFNSSGVATSGMIPVAISGYSETNPTVAMDSYGDFTVGYFTTLYYGNVTQSGNIYAA